MNFCKCLLAVFLLNFFVLHAAAAQQPFLPGSKLNLADCEAVAVQNHPDLLSAREVVNALSSRARGASGEYWPQIDLESDYIRGNFINISGPAQSLLTGVFTTYVTQFSTTWVLEDFGQRYARKGKAGAELAEAEASYHGVRSKVIFNAARAYFKVLSAKAFLKVSEDALTAAQKHMELAKGFVKTGEKSEIELAKARVVFAKAQFDYLKAQNDLENARLSLNQAMGLENPPDYEIREDDSIPILNLSLIEAKATAYRARPDLLVAKARVDQAKARVNELSAKRWPVLSGNAGYGWLDQSFPPQIKIWGLGLSLRWPLFDGWRLSNEIKEALYQEKSSEKKVESLLLQVNKEVEEDFRSIQAADERLKAATEEVAAANENEKLAMLGYKEGLGSPVELADAEADLSLARAQYVQAFTDLRIAQFALKQAIGMESI